MMDSVQISVRGVVQGVGFRPFVYQLAKKHHLTGWVCNTSEDVKIEIEGKAESIETFLIELRNNAPPRASIENLTVERQPAKNYKDFEIRPSIAEEGKYQLVSPDIATCPDCLTEIFDHKDRRFRYSFTNCTNCGPRFTIIKDIPYDRPKTTMRMFQMCPACQAEYDNPLNRRFHAQPNACPKCGPSLTLLDAKGKEVETKDAIKYAGKLLKGGKIVAVKGLGGFLLACDATSEAAVNRLRERKNRPSKPLAIMVSTLSEAKKYCHVNDEEARLLASVAGPIVLLEMKPDAIIANAVAPNLKYLGVMLPYTPLHHLLLREIGLPLVMTSGNLSEEPIAKDNYEAVRRLSGIADYFLVHNRDIYSSYDDSVTLVENGVPQVVRRARGYAPYPVHLGFRSKQILACGAEEKNTFCLMRDNHAFVSQHIGDMENMETLDNFENTIELYKKLFRIKPEIVAYDMHPEYLATKYAKELAEKTGITTLPIQHHHAHIVSCMADNGIDKPVIGVSFDGTGYGTDGNIWGGEFLLADYRGFRRVGQLEYLPLPGGAQAIKRPYRTAIGYTIALLGEDALEGLPSLKDIQKQEIKIIKNQIEKKLNAPLTSSCGRLFDAVSALIGVRGEIMYEAQAAVELEMAAYDAPHESGSYAFAVEYDTLCLMRLEELFCAIIRDLYNGVSQAHIAAKFHNTVANMIDLVCRNIRERDQIDRVALSGGVFQNRLLFKKTVECLEQSGFQVFTHRQVPCNDGGLSLGQAVIANFSR